MKKITYIWEDFNHQKLKLLKNKYKLKEVVKSGKHEFEKQLLLKDWICKTLPLGFNPKSHYKNSLVILKDAEKGYEFFCTHYVLTFIQTATALGWYARKVSIDHDHKFREEEMHHAVCDIWSNTYKKWVVIDPMHNLHFEKNGTPLNVYEVRIEYLKNKAKDIVGIVGDYREKLKYGKYKKGFDQPSNYFWFFILLKNNFFTDPDIYGVKTLLWSDEYNSGKTWYMGGRNKGRYRKHPLYKGGFIKTSDLSLCFPKMN